MPSQPRNMPEQEHSIKARSHELFFEEAPQARATKPFAAYLRETPARPLSLAIKAIFWLLGVIVALLFALAVWRVIHHPARRPRAVASAPRAAMSPDARRHPAVGIARAVTRG